MKRNMLPHVNSEVSHRKVHRKMGRDPRPEVGRVMGLILCIVDNELTIGLILFDTVSDWAGAYWENEFTVDFILQ